MTKRPLIVANWKMNHGISDTFKFLTHINRIELTTETVDVVLCPPFTSLYTLSVALAEASSKVMWGAQNCHTEDSGAFTGEISAEFLTELGCSFVIAGHSERRQLLGEKNDFIAQKVLKVLEKNMTPILCVGETLEQRDQGSAVKVVEEQLHGCLKDIERSDIEKIVVAYEPVWAIGTGRTATPEQAQEMHHAIRNWLGNKYGRSFAGNVRLLYGGSVKPDNIKSLMTQDDVDGALVGGASLNAETFREILAQSV